MKRKHSFFTEMIIGIAIIVIINVLWFEDDLGFTAVSPNPLWIIVIFIAARYGSLAGLISGLSCSLVLLALAGYGGALKVNLSYLPIPYKQIQLSGLFVLFGFLVGEERRRVNRLLELKNEQYNKLRNDFESLAMERLAFKNVTTELEGRILGQADTFNTLYTVAQSLVTLKVDTLYPSIISLVEKFIAPDKCSLYIWEGDRYLLKGQSGYSDGVTKSETIDLDSDIIKKALAEKRLVTVKDVYKAQNLRWEEGKDPAMVSPLFFGEKDTAAGFILIDKISFLKLNPDSMRLLAVMSDWVSKSLDNAFATTTVRLEDIYDKELEVFNYNYALRRLKEELLSVGVSKKPSSLLLIKISDFENIDSEHLKRVLKGLGYVLKHTVRAADIVSAYSREDMFLVVLPGSNIDGANIVEERLKTAIAKFDFKAFADEKKKLEVSFFAGALDPKHKTETELLAEAEKSLG